MFLLFLVIAWIPADFGLAFFTAQLAQNASREAARIAAADPNVASGSCNMPCSSAPGGTALKAAADRMSPTLLPGALISRDLRTARRSELQPSGTGISFWRIQLLFLPTFKGDGQHNTRYLKYRKINKYEVGAPARMSDIN